MTTTPTKPPVGGIAGWLSATEAAAYIGRSTKQLDKLRNDPRALLRVHPCYTAGPARRIHAYRYDPASLDALLYREATQDERDWK